MESPITSFHWNDTNGNPAGGATYGHGFAISWQNGPLNEPGGGRNGAFVEEVIEAALDRLIWYQTTRFQCQENAEAAEHLNAALSALHRRTSRRVAAGTEGTHRGN